MKLFNTLTNKKEELNDKVINIYSCGPTVYNYLHIGNARPIFLSDILIRYLNSLNIKTNHLTNITDIDDKIINKAILENKTEKEISEKYIKSYYDNLEKLNILVPNKIICISEKINEIINFINELVKSKDAYISNGTVYFDIEKNKDEYGKLSNKNIDELISGSRIDIDHNKKNPLDFALWKKTNIGIMFDSDFGSGRPGWHTECVTLIKDYFDNKTIDIHIGGIDLAFPHQENERIQFIANQKKELSKIWLHNGHLNFNDEKMSKSLGNVILIKDYIKEYSSDSLRWIFLNTGYKKPINVTKQLIDESLLFMNKIQSLKKKISIYMLENSIENYDIEIYNEYILKFNNYMNDNLNTPLVISLINDLIKLMNKNIKNEYILIYKYILDVLGFDKDNFNFKISTENKKLYNEWKKMLDNKKYKEADIIRNDLIKKGIL